jgi:hypothetical protein
LLSVRITRAPGRRLLVILEKMRGCARIIGQLCFLKGNYARFLARSKRGPRAAGKSGTLH